MPGHSIEADALASKATKRPGRHDSGAAAASPSTKSRAAAGGGAGGERTVPRSALFTLGRPATPRPRMAATEVLALQGAAGNRAVQRLLAPLPVQRQGGTAVTDARVEQESDESEQPEQQQPEQLPQPEPLDEHAPAEQQSSEPTPLEQQQQSAPQPGTNRLDEQRDRLPTRGGITAELLKPSLAGVATGAGYGVGSAMGTSSGAFQGATMSGGMATGVFGGLSTIDQAMGVVSGARRYYRDRDTDESGAKLGKRKALGQGVGVAAGLAGLVGTGFKLASASGSGGSLAQVGAGGAMIAGGGITALQGAHRIRHAVGKYREIGEVEVFSSRGKGWKSFMRSKEVRKGAAGFGRMVAGGLGVAAGAALLSGNPLAAFGLGIAGAAVGGAMALWKLGRKITESVKARKTKKRLQEEDPQGYEAARGDPEKAAGLADRVQQRTSDTGRVAGELRGAYRSGKAEMGKAQKAYRKWQTASGYWGGSTEDPEFKRTWWLIPRDQFPSRAGMEAFDAARLLQAINVSPTMIDSRSGQDLIVKKLSMAEAM